MHLETLGKVNTVVLDKIGTLTFGRPQLQTIVPVDGVAADDVLNAAATAELRSEHPRGQAIVAYARTKGRAITKPDRFHYAPGRGIAAEVGASTVIVGNAAWMQDRPIPIPGNISHGVETVTHTGHSIIECELLTGT